MPTTTESSGEPPLPTLCRSLTRLQKTLAVCPTDISARGELATLLERLDQPEEALFNWSAVLACYPNSLTAREGVVRCRQQMGRRLQSKL